ncbi:MAG: hypothetical protein Ct9H90mP15_02210 [Candidatus Neomarinimicrobiota bacterium]|nr:MAG: hypothetical protein Ct9H90mP15_02210 [Candidatus Neomarinimicrobiota bacterium]
MILRPTFRFLSMLVMFLSFLLLIPGLLDYLDSGNLYLFKIAGFSFASVIPSSIYQGKHDLFLIEMFS